MRVILNKFNHFFKSILSIKALILLLVINMFLFFITHIMARENIRLNGMLYRYKKQYIKEFEKNLKLEADYAKLFNEREKGNVFDKGKKLKLKPVKASKHEY